MICPQARTASLDYIVANGGVITDAVSIEKWPGDARVHGSLVHWVKQPAEPITTFTLDGTDGTCFASSFRVRGDSDWIAAVLPQNRGECSQGPIPVRAGFIVSGEVAARLLADESADHSEVLRAFLTSVDIASSTLQSPSRRIVDFDQMSRESANRYTFAPTIVHSSVKLECDKSDERDFRTKWWLFGRPRVPLRAALAPLNTSFAVGSHAKRMLIAKVESRTIASDATNFFAFDDDYSMGILISRARDARAWAWAWAWAWAQSSTLETRLR